MKHFNLLKTVFLVISIIVGLFYTADAQELKGGEYATKDDGTPAIIGQATNDHLFVRGSYDDMGPEQMYDNVVSFKSGTPQVVEFWLDDDQIYTNEAVQALIPVPWADGGEELYNEITYSSGEFYIYLPVGFSIIKYKFPGEIRKVDYQQGDRMPWDALLQWYQQSNKEIDGYTYNVYKFVITNMNYDACHFSGNEETYAENGGALKKDDGCLFRLAIENTNQDIAEGRLPDMIIANQEFGICETIRDQWNSNEARFFYGSGGNNTSQRFMKYHRVALYGSNGINDETPILATSISLNKNSTELTVGESMQLTATILPSNTTDMTVRWTTSNSAVATVNNSGRVTAMSPGTATIIATTTDGSNLSASCLVTVRDDLSVFENYLSIDDAEAFHGDTIFIPVAMTNTESIISFQTDIFLPEGLEMVQEDGEYLIEPSGRMTRTHSLMSNDISSGAVRVLCYSSNYKPFTGNSGDDLFYITVKVAENAEGNYTIQLKNTLFTTSDFDEIVAPNVTANVLVKAYLLGDANNSGNVTVTDVVVTSQYVLEMNPQPFIFEAADVNADCTITVTDVSRIAWMVLNPTISTPRRTPALTNNGDRMNAKGISLMAGETRTVSIALDNEMDYSAFQLDLTLPDGLTASNFALTDRACSHAFDVNTLANGKTRALCYSPSLNAIRGNDGALLTFDVTATGLVNGDILVDGIELVTTDCQTVKLDTFTIGVNNATAVDELATGKTIARVDYFNVAGQRLDHPQSGVTIVVTTYTDGTRTTTKVIQ